MVKPTSLGRSRHERDALVAIGLEGALLIAGFLGRRSCVMRHEPGDPGLARKRLRKLDQSLLRGHGNHGFLRSGLRCRVLCGRKRSADRRLAADAACLMATTAVGEDKLCGAHHLPARYRRRSHGVARRDMGSGRSVQGGRNGRRRSAILARRSGGDSTVCLGSLLFPQIFVAAARRPVRLCCECGGQLPDRLDLG